MPLAEQLPHAGLHASHAPLPFTITGVRRETADVFTWTLEPQNAASEAAQKLLQFSPGQFNMLYVFGAGEVPISIAGGHPDGAGYSLLHTIRAVGSVTNVMHTLREGATIGIRGPYGTAWPIADATGQDIVIITGGIGLAPLRPVITHIVRHREKYGHVAILYGARTPHDLLFADDRNAWAARKDLQFETTVDMGLDGWRGDVGLVTKLISRVNFDRTHTTAMMCGPEIMMRFCAKELAARGLPESSMIVSLERNMQCGIGQCGHCMVGPKFICKDGAVFAYPDVKTLLEIPEI